MRRNIIITIILTLLLSPALQSCVKDLEKEGIHVTTRFYGTLQDMHSLQPLQGVKVVSTNGKKNRQTVYTESDGSFSVNIDVQQLNDGYYIAIQPDSLYEAQNIYIDNRALGQESFDIGVVRIKGPSVPVLNTSNATDITASSAKLHGSIVQNGNSTISECGFVYDVIQYPTIENNKVTVQNRNGMLETEVQLSPNTTYYVRAYARNSMGIGYGPQIAFRTLEGLPTVGNPEISNIRATAATCSGSFYSDGGFPINDRGICWSTTPDPTLENLHINLGTGIGDYETELSNLQPNTTYYLRAYARNLSGIAYSQTVTFTTLNGLPTVTTAQVTNITTQSAICGGNISNDSGFPTLQRGVCYSTSPLPTTADSHTSDGAGNGSFTSHLHNLTPATTYYVRAYATNVNGTSYGEQIVFVTQ